MTKLLLIFSVRLLQILFFYFLCSYLYLNYISLDKYVQHKINRDNVQFLSSQVEQYINHNENNLPTIYLDGPDPILFYLTHGAFNNPLYYQNYLSDNNLDFILDNNKFIYLVGYNPIFLKYRYHTKNNFLTLKNNDELTITFEKSLISNMVVNLFFYDDKDKKEFSFINLLDDNFLIDNKIDLKNENNKLFIKNLGNSVGFQICYKNCTSGWLLGKSVELTLNGKSVDLSLKDKKNKYGEFDVISSSGSLFFAKTSGKN